MKKHKCGMEVNGRLELPCDEPATVKIEGGWYCEHHGTALGQAAERWSGVNWFALTDRDIEEQPDLNEADGRFWDDEEK